MILFILLSVTLIMGGLMLVVMQRIVSNGRVGASFIRFILLHLPGDYEVFYDVILTFGGRQAQVNHIVVSPYGIFVIDTKNYPGFTFGYSYDTMWKRSLFGIRYTTASPLLENQHRVHLLTDQLIYLRGFEARYIQSVVAVGIGSFLRLKDKPANVLSVFRLYSYIRSFRNPVIPYEVCKEVTRILSAQQPSLSFRRW